MSVPQHDETHRFLPIMPAAGQRWRGQESGRVVRLTGPAPDGPGGGAFWFCEVNGRPDLISEWQLSWCTPIGGEGS